MGAVGGGERGGGGAREGIWEETVMEGAEAGDACGRAEGVWRWSLQIKRWEWRMRVMNDPTGGTHSSPDVSLSKALRRPMCPPQPAAGEMAVTGCPIWEGVRGGVAAWRMDEDLKAEEKVYWCQSLVDVFGDEFRGEHKREWRKTLMCYFWVTVG